MKQIVLAHGVLGFGSLGPLNYFNGVARHLEREVRGIRVTTTHVNPIAGIEKRGTELAARIVHAVPEGEVHILAHSMGGLDARFAIRNVPGFKTRVASLVTIGTPHHGSPVADAILSRGGPLFDAIPPMLRAELEHNAAALRDLTTSACKAFDAATPDEPQIRYFEIAGDVTEQGACSSFFFKLAAAIGHAADPRNDGVVTFASATRGRKPFDVWACDHAGEIGWNLDLLIPFEVPLPFIPSPPHFARYEAIVSAL